MCLLIACKPGYTPSEGALLRAATNNPDGFGYALVIGEGADAHIHMHRGMSAVAVIDDFLAMRERHPEGHAIWHARFATHGTMTKDNCHPFRVAGRNDTFLAHNGILPLWIAPTDNRSDTRVFAEDILPAFGLESLDSWRTRTALEDLIGTDKVAILTVNPELKSQLYLLNEKMGDWGAKGGEDEGVWYSNGSHRYVKSVPYSAGATLLDKADDDDRWLTAAEQAELMDWWTRHGECAACQAIMEPEDDICPFCQTCRWCGYDMVECVCTDDDKAKDRDLSDELADMNGTDVQRTLALYSGEGWD